MTKESSDQVREYLKKNRITKGDIAQKAGMSLSYVTQMLNGQMRVSDTFLSKLPKCFPINVKKLKKGEFVFKKNVL